MGISTSPSKPWLVVAGGLILIWSVMIWITLKDPLPDLKIPASALGVLGLVIAAVLAYNVFGPEAATWTRPAAMIGCVLGLVMAALVAAYGAPEANWALLLMSVGSSVGFVALYLEKP